MPPSLMASTRRPPTVDVLEDPDASSTTHGGEDVETALLHALGPLNDASHNPNVHFDPPASGASGASPTKTDSSPMRPVTAHNLQDINIPPPVQPDFTTDSPRKNANFYPMYYAPPQPQTDFMQMPAGPFYPGYSGKENYYGATHFPAPQIMPYGELEQGYTAPAKRPLMDPTPARDRAKKQKTEQDEQFDLPDPKDMPTVHDDGTKPSHSYAELIGMAILRSPNRRLTLAQIYKWISDHFSFYKAAESGWQNSIRHNLSLNKNFIKQERPKDDPGKGNYWAIKPGEEKPFLLGKKNPIRRITNPDGTQYIGGLPHEMGYQASSTPAISHFTLAPNPVKRNEVKAIDSAKFPDDTDLLSDGTLPASDAALDEEEKDDAALMMPPPANIRSSPPPVDLGSSPPQMANTGRKGTTPPPVPRFSTNSRSGSRRQKFGGLNDSGYWSSIESSAARGSAQVLTSEADITRPRLRKGRAETEIARIRSSSFGSPSTELHKIKPPTSHFDSSSPIRDDHPLTPAVVFKRPAKPPPSVSPNTNLRNHRNRMRALLGTPAKTFSPAPAVHNWSPAFNIGEEGGVGLTPYISPFKATKSPWKGFQDTPGTASKNLFNAAFDIFIDAPEADIVERGSPGKRSARRPSLVRAATSTGILADITGSGRSNNITLAPPNDSPFSFSPFLIKQGALRSPTKLGSPLKQSHCPPSFDNTDDKWLLVGLGEENVQPSLDVGNDATLFGIHLPSDGSEEAIDIFQDFGKIGGAASSLLPVPNRANGSPVKRSVAAAAPTRPTLGRSNTSRW